MANFGQFVRRMPPKVLYIAFWGLFMVVAAISFLASEQLGYNYGVETSLATYSTVLQGLGMFLAILAVGVFLRKHRLDSEMGELEDRTLQALSFRLGWSGVAWTPELEDRVVRELSYGAVPQAEWSPPPQAPGPAPVYQAQVPPPPAGDENLEQELDDLLDTLVVDDSVEGAQQIMVETQPPPQPVQAVESVPSFQAVAPGQDHSDILKAVGDHRALEGQRKVLMRTMIHPLGMSAALVALCAWATPSATTALAQQAALNTSMVFLSTYGAIITVLFSALAALRAAVA